MVQEYLYRARRCLEEANLAFEEEDFPGAVRRSQEGLELAVKALLRSRGVEYPREHDVSPALTAVEGRLPDELRLRVAELRSLLGELARVRGPAFYGFEREGIAPRKAFNSEYAEKTLRKVTGLAEACFRAVEQPS